MLIRNIPMQDENMFAGELVHAQIKVKVKVKVLVEVTVQLIFH